jgi:putative endonuclease
VASTLAAGAIRMAASHDLGRSGENAAARFLEAAGWRVLARNFRSGRNEIDLIVRRGSTVAFVEVKTRSTGTFGHPLEAVTAQKRREIERVARSWIARAGPPGVEFRFDAVAVCWDGRGTPAIEHVPDAWRR